jgi:ArsR family transcriptional regulator
VVIVYSSKEVDLLDFEMDIQIIENFNKRSEMFKSLSDPNRLRILYILKDGEKCVSEILPFFDILQPTVSVHLLKLQESGLLDVRRDGRKRYYRLSDHRVLDLINSFYNKIQSRKI